MQIIVSVKFANRAFLFVTTYETESGFLLIEVFRKLINPQIEGHLDHIQVAFLIYQGQ